MNEQGVQYLNGALQQNRVWIIDFIDEFYFCFACFQTITVLNLCSNDIKDKGTRYLCDALRNNRVTFKKKKKLSAYIFLAYLFRY